MLLLILWIGLLVILVFLAARFARLLARDSIDNHPRRTGRLCALALLGAVLGVVVHLDYARDRDGGREAFLAFQAHRFDTFISRTHGIVPEVILGILVAGAALGVYELIAWAFYLVIRPARKQSA